MAGRKKGSTKTGGRKAGTPNKLTSTIKSAFKDAFDELGGVHALVGWARQNETEFYKLASKLIPIQVGGDPDAPIVHEVRRTVVRP